MLDVIIVPSDGTGASPVVRKYPQIIHFKWPNRDCDGALEKAITDYSKAKAQIQTRTYLSGFKDIMDPHLAPFNKKVLVFTEKAETPDSPPSFGCPARLTPIRGTRITEDVQGILRECRQY